MKKKLRKKVRRFRSWLCQKLVPDSDARMMLILAKGRVRIPETKILSTQVVLNEESYKFMHSYEGKVKYDAVYGLTRQLADDLKDYVRYTESYDEEHKEWTCKIELEVVK